MTVDEIAVNVCFGSIIFFLVALTILINNHRWNKFSQLKACSELAKRTGLIYDPGKTSFQGGYTQYNPPPSISGKYRGRELNWNLGQTYQTSTLSLVVKNQAHCSLTIQRKGIFHKWLGNNQVTSGSDDFDRRFKARGHPPSFIHRTLGRIVSVNSPQPTWITNAIFSINLKDTSLNCELDVITDVDKQIELLDLLSELTDLVEQMGKQPAASPELVDFPQSATGLEILQHRSSI